MRENNRLLGFTGLEGGFSAYEQRDILMFYGFGYLDLGQRILPKHSKELKATTTASSVVAISASSSSLSYSSSSSSSTSNKKKRVVITPSPNTIFSSEPSLFSPTRNKKSTPTLQNTNHQLEEDDNDNDNDDHDNETKQDLLQPPKKEYKIVIRQGSSKLKIAPKQEDHRYQEVEEEEEQEQVDEEEEEEDNEEEQIDDTSIDTKYKQLKVTPAMQQYYHFKKLYPSHILLFRIGDFYEMFNDDAITVSSLLHITLTSRGIKNTTSEIPMCGFPYHSADNYIEKLIRHGKTVAVCDQVESVQSKSKGSKVVKRQVVRVVTPGTVYEDRFLQPFQNNYLLSLYPSNESMIKKNNTTSRVKSKEEDMTNQKFILSWLDLSTGQFYLSQTTYDNLAGEIYRISPSEILLPKIFIDNQDITKMLKPYHVTIEDTSNYSLYNNHSMFKEAYDGIDDLQMVSDSFPNFSVEQLGVAGSILNYIYNTQLGRIPHVYQLQQYSQQQSMSIDYSTRNSLELTKTLQNTRKGSLLDVIDKTQTATGSRLLHYRLQSPSLSIEEINCRLNLLEYFHDNNDLVRETRRHLSRCHDLERCLQRVYIGKAGPRDLASIGSTLSSLSNLKSIISKHLSSKANRGHVGNKQLIQLVDSIADFDQLLNELSEALVDNPPIGTQDGGFIQQSYSKELKEFINTRDHSKELISGIQKKYRSSLSLSTLKIKYTQAIGHFFEILSTNRHKIPNHFIHVQTLMSHMRFKSSDLIEMEEKINRAQSQAYEIEIQIFQQLCDLIKEYGDKIKEASQILAQIDISTSLALISHERNYIRPKISEKPILNIIGGRHPTVEVAQMEKIGSFKQFITNDCHLDYDTNTGLILITGPNMGGKSTFIRQNALITIMAQMGCFVPADSAEIGISDSVFSRVGSSDDLANDRSTFMVEMVETASILKKATSRSLVIMDEVGRGTSTLDGAAIARAVIEHLYANKTRTLFATHHHELTSLASHMPNIQCYALAVKEEDDDLLFTHKVMPGISNKSYGIFCARLAGVPLSVIQRSQQILEQLENATKSIVVNNNKH
ncbi:mutS like protein [Cavenderia fasciculata]|uniref:MutS like protein n=1 Tax=Cavenderia fasciculata TaxID=261658 RepID=F4Q980_CACFS|nr:mutS like protein [Cavenderia fasciculata]EGG15249.1 mutS like protein [Cavenderia fasciculata]|eukprot:XP_004351969.1 mutS like protein [Cavenderia fasciculata]